MTIQDKLADLLSWMIRWVGGVFNAFMTMWRLAIYWINRAILYMDYGGKRRTDFYHKVLLIGDGLAQGFGASISTGCTNGVIRKLNNSYHRQPNIRTKWCFFERGVLNSTTEDWSPTGKRLEKTLNSFACRDVEMVVIMVGLQDLMKIKDASELLDLVAQTAGNKQIQDEIPLVKNLRAIVQHLLQKGLHVCVCNLPLVGEPTSVRAKVIGGVNRQIKLLIDSFEGKVSLVEANTRRVSKKENRSYDGVHLNTDGYNALGLAILEQINPHMVQIEWSAFQVYLKGEKAMPDRKRKWYQVNAPKKQQQATRGAVSSPASIQQEEEEKQVVDDATKKTQ